MSKLTIVGGGSAYTPDILESLLVEKELFAGWEWVLHDVDERAVRIIANLIRALVRAAGADISVRWTTDRDEAVAGARFVLAQPRPGGLKARSLDEKIPLRHGVLGQETLGAGGLSFAWRSIPVVLDLITSMRREAPDAWLISYTNPAGMVAEAVIRRYPDARFIALCDMPTGVQWEASRVLRVDPHRLELEYRGINHGGWMDRILLDGREDVLPRLRRLARWLPVRWLPVGEVTGTIRLLQEHGRMPDPYLRYYYYRDALVAKLRAKKQTRADEVMAKVKHLYDHFAEQSKMEQPQLRVHRGHASHSDLAAALIRAMVAGRRERFIIQQRNQGHLQGLPLGRAAQFPAQVGPEGWEPLPVAPLPEPEGELIRQVQEAEALNVSATLAGDRTRAAEAMALNPLVGSRSLANRLVEELLAAHRPYLPTFYQ